MLLGGGAERNHDKAVKIVSGEVPSLNTDWMSVFKLDASRLRSGNANNYDRFCYAHVHLVKKTLLL